MSHHTNALRAFSIACTIFDEHPHVVGPPDRCPPRLALGVAIQDAERAMLDGYRCAQDGHSASVEIIRRRNVLIRGHMRPIVFIAQDGQGSLAFLQWLRMPPASARTNDGRLEVEALAMADQVEPYKGAFVNAGLPLDFAEQLRLAATALEHAVQERNTARGGATRARVELAAAIRRGRTQLRLLTLLLEPKLRDAGIWEQWKAVTRYSPAAPRSEDAHASEAA